MKDVKCSNCRNLVNDWCEKKTDSPDPTITRNCVLFEQMTNADKIRAMSDEELADFFVPREAVKEFYRDYDVSGVIPSETLILEVARNMRIAWLNWLNQPAEVEHDQS